MELQEFLESSTAILGLPAYEAEVAAYIAEAFKPLADEVKIDGMNNVVSRLGERGPKIMVSAHLDEIGLVVSQIEKDGCLRFVGSGGVDPRILPGMEVRVYAKEGPLFGVIGAKPPHLLSAEDRKKALDMPDMYIDIGFPPEVVREKVRVGDQVAMLAPARMLAGEHMAAKSLDDRASVGAMLEAAKILRAMKVEAQIFLVASAQEEVGSFGALTAAYSLAPDAAIAIDVTHGEGPGTGPFEALPLDKVALSVGPTIHPALYKCLKETAEKNGVAVAVEVAGGHTWTDADEIQTSRAGVPTALISIPLRYMHTSVETLSLHTVRETGRLLALSIAALGRDWGDMQWN